MISFYVSEKKHTIVTSKKFKTAANLEEELVKKNNPRLRDPEAKFRRPDGI